MQMVRGWRDVPAHLKGGSLAIGNFDGVHRGHQAVLDAAMQDARSLRAPAGAMVFEPHPRKYFQPAKPLFRLTSLERKLDLLAAYGLDFAAVLSFDATLAGLSAAEFVKQVLADGYAARRAATGFDFFFGKGREGDTARLQELGRQHGFGVTIVGAVGDSGEIFSSTRIRELLAEGDVAGAADMLGHWWRIKGAVIAGAGRGAGLGFPTANIAMEDGQALQHGIYAVRVYLSGKRHHAAAYLGTRPTFIAGPPVLEVYLFDFENNLYNFEIEVEFIAFIRPDAKFKSAGSLAAQMTQDCAKARALLARIETDDPLATQP